MLMPKRVKRRKQMRGRMTGKATRGNKLAYGDFGLVATEPAWIKSNQIEAARVAMTRFIKRGGKYGLIFSHTNQLLNNLLELVWVAEKVQLNIG